MTDASTTTPPPSSPSVTGAGIKVGYARVSTSGQDLTAQRHALTALGVSEDRVYVDHGLTSTNRARPGLREALAACRTGDTLVVTKLDRLARSLSDARDIADELTVKGVALNLGGSVHDPNDPVGRLLFNVLGMVAEFESDLIQMRTKEGLAVARANGKLRGRQPKLSPRQEAHLAALHATGEHTPSDLAHLFRVGRDTAVSSYDDAGHKIYYVNRLNNPDATITITGLQVINRGLTATDVSVRTWLGDVTIDESTREIESDASGKIYFCTLSAPFRLEPQLTTEVQIETDCGLYVEELKDTPQRARRCQLVGASAAASSSASFSAGVAQPRVCRDRSLSSVATASR